MRMMSLNINSSRRAVSVWIASSWTFMKNHVVCRHSAMATSPPDITTTSLHSFITPPPNPLDQAPVIIFPRTHFHIHHVCSTTTTLWFCFDEPRTPPPPPSPSSSNHHQSHQPILNHHGKQLNPYDVLSPPSAPSSPIHTPSSTFPPPVMPSCSSRPRTDPASTRGVHSSTSKPPRHTFPVST
ncbi:hypothetical protein EX30DRAFT_242941 [Ascodesmis nigricans]|uniref:Uncharacterized protein n=1 Tax=Ascodesmis nigricans TaxID=341454 RepID=A0A4S2MQI1_9PEZI|nr:hypothetical protein EX30DRAFT_242941 [Ascodesmis nigricans]